MNLPELMTVNEAAQFLNVSHHTIRRRIADGDLHAVRLGPSEQAPLRIDRRDLFKFLRPVEIKP